MSRGYTSIYFYSGWFPIEKNKLEGICDIMGKEVVAPKYEYVFPHDHINGYIYFEVVFNGRRGVCSMNGQEIITPKYDEVVCVDQDGYSYYYVELNGKKGACDMNGREIISPRYESWYFSSSSGTFQYEDSSGKWVSTGVKLEKSSSSAYASSSTTGGSSSSSSGGKSGGSSSSSGKSGGSKLLYQGDYNEGVHVTNGVSFPNDVPYRIIGAEVSIYEDKIDFYGNVIEFKKNQNGNRVYQDYNNKVVVDPDYNFTYYYILPGWDGDDIVTSARFTRIDSYSPQGGYYGGGGTGTYTGGNTGNDGNKGNTTTTQTKQHKCGVCGGTGREIRTDAASLGKTKYCSECGKTVPDYHYHAPCRSCGGKGWW